METLEVFREKEKKKNRNDDSDENDDNSFLPTAFGKKIKEGAMRREKERERERLEKKRGKHQSAGQDVSGDVGKFEKHTKGIGLKIRWGVKSCKSIMQP